jgi:hypothetical protein
MCANVVKFILKISLISVGNPSRLLFDLRIGDGRRTDAEEHLDKSRQVRLMAFGSQTSLWCTQVSDLPY